MTRNWTVAELEAGMDRADIPATMLQPVTFDLDDDGPLQRVALQPVTESDDEAW